MKYDNLEEIYKKFNKKYNKNKKGWESVRDINNIWDTDIWDKSFVSEFGFPNNEMGFTGQWCLPKLYPFINYLVDFHRIETIKISYKKISETNCFTLEKLYNHVRKNHYCPCDYNNRYKCDNKYCYHCDDSIKNIDYILKKTTWSNYNNFKFQNFTFKFNTIEDINTFKTEKLHLFNDKERENILNMLNILEQHFSNGFPFFTLYLPENIKDTEFEEIHVVDNDGNFYQVIARSKEYFYYFDYCT
jgi:hypothetical protein